MAASIFEFVGAPFPSWPPSWQGRGPYLQWWLCGFLSAVGALKAAGFLRHDLSQIAGFVEFVGALIFLPCWKPLQASSGLKPEACVRLGSWIILAALGIIVSTKKRKSPVCWSQIMFALELLRTLGGPKGAKDFSGVLIGVAAVVVGVVAGVAMQKLALFDDSELLEAKTK
eukprot:TRINITY_DN71398_c0_g1_i1.p1 TRINITY_DN71398_c0_g1~~TRINITY_DN71398_c0_g1_i1.p1  ORF type:complete len:171 (+),score=32.13 TRINITY_DN71398_c0_g1_i1:90-602(+)